MPPTFHTAALLGQVVHKSFEPENDGHILSEMSKHENTEKRERERFDHIDHHHPARL
jgi:hypothetical protein